MYSHIEDKNYNHLVCVILGGSEKECKLHGLAHVGEHMCLCLKYRILILVLASVYFHLLYGFYKTAVSCNRTL